MRHALSSSVPATNATGTAGRRSLAVAVLIAVAGRGGRGLSTATGRERSVRRLLGSPMPAPSTTDTAGHRYLAVAVRIAPVVPRAGGLAA
jgi:hypothetical protein